MAMPSRSTLTCSSVVIVDTDTLLAAAFQAALHVPAALFGKPTQQRIVKASKDVDRK